MRRFLTITWNSWSWKSSLWLELEKKWWKTLYNYTTRKPRSDEELDTYIFLTDKQFEIKRRNWDFIETIEYNWNKYAFSSIIPEWNIYVIVTPEWRTQLRDLFNDWKLWVDKFDSIFLSLDSKLQRSRLEKRWDSEDDIVKRLEYDFQPTSNCAIYNWADDTIELAKEIHNVYS